MRLINNMRLITRVYGTFVEHRATPSGEVMHDMEVVLLRMRMAYGFGNRSSRIRKLCVPS